MSREAKSLSQAAVMQGRLWSARARDWAELQETQHRPLFEAAYQAAGVGPGQRVLDVGCGAGVATQVAIEHGARASGIDPAEGLITIATERVPEGEFRVGEIEDLPYSDGSFDLVSTFNVLQFLSQPAAALGEARRVCRPGGTVAVAVPGPPAELELAAMIMAVKAFIPEPPAGAPGLFDLSHEARLKEVMDAGGLQVERVEKVPVDFHYPDLESAQRAILSAGPAVMAIQSSGEKRVREAVSRALEAFKSTDGGYRLENAFLCGIGRA